MRDLLSTINRDADGLFLTLTYHESNPGGREVKKHLHAFVQALRRRWDGLKWSMVWRLEYQERGVPHLHFLIWGIQFEHKEWFKACWHRITGETSDDHEEMGAWVERMPKESKLSSYVSKYMAKDGTDPDGWQGRTWGVRNRKHLPVAPMDWVQGVPWWMALALAEETLDSWGCDIEVTPFSLRIWCEDPEQWIREKLGYDP